tara:strand:+ start:105 stop:575 length:471 start_codon:yes stop_codon:yes gene_type:complete
MSEKIIKAGIVTIGVTDLSSDINAFLKLVAPSTIKMMDVEFDKIERTAKEDWPKRQLTKKYDRKTNRYSFKDESQNSWNKFQRGARIEQGNIIVFLKNTASYAWAIKVGVQSENAKGQHVFLPQGKRVAQVLLFSPLAPASRRIAKALADDLSRRY